MNHETERQHRVNLDRIANVEDYDDDDDAITDGETLLGIALDYEKEIDRLRSVMQEKNNALSEAWSSASGRQNHGD